MGRTLLSLLFAVISFTLAAQDLTVTGSVTSAEDGEPLIGATVKVKGELKAVTTDIDGNYTIKVASGKTLQFTYLGFAMQEHKVTGTNLNVVMEPENDTLDELVVIGYGAVKKSDLTGAVSSVDADKLTKTPAASLSNALQGQVAGVTVNSLTGRPGEAAEVRIRGIGTTNGSAPIYVVDGVITDNINFVSTSDIDHIEVLKDASATAIYGARGANGVIIVTTKNGKLNTPTHISFNGYIGFQQRWKKLDVMDAKTFADTYLMINGTKAQRKIYEEQGFNAWLSIVKNLRNSDDYPTVYDPVNNPTGFDYSSVNTDWQDEVFRTGLIQNYSLSIDGGTDRLTYSMSGSWFSQEGIVIGSGYNRLTARLNTSFQAFPWLKIGENISFMSAQSKNAMNGGDNTESPGANILSAAFAMAPWDPVRYPEGTVNRKGEDMGGRIAAGSNFRNVRNPFSMVEYNHPKVNNERFVGNVFLDLTPIKHFVLHSSYSFDYQITRDKSFQDHYRISDYDGNEKNFLSSSMSRSYYWNNDNILTYTNTFGKNDITAMAGFTVEEYNYTSIGGAGFGILNPDERNWYLSQVTESAGKTSESVARNRRQSWLGRVNYSYDGRYLATVNFRADGSSKFKEHKWGYFPSFALAWRISRESFMSQATALTDLKLRFGWGRVGNDNVGNDAFVLNMFNNGPTFVDYVFGKNQQLANGAAILTWINNGGHWENTEQWSLGVDFSLFNGMLSGTIDGFIRDTNDMLMYVNTPAQVGNRYMPMANVGKVRNKGIEISLDHKYRVNDWFSYSVGGNISFIHNELTELNGGSPIRSNYELVTVVDEGYPLYYFWGLQTDGIFRTDQEALDYWTGYDANTIPFHAGDTKYIDANGNGTFEPDDDRVDLGSSIPKINYGINIGANLKDFDLQLFFQGISGSKIYNQMRHRLESNGLQSVLSPVMTDAWTPDNPEGSIANPRNTVNYYVSDRFLESGDYFRLKDLQIGYSLPKSILGDKGLSRCRFYVQASNVFTWTKYKGFDPEVSGGVDKGNYPQCRTFLFGVNIEY